MDNKRDIASAGCHRKGNRIWGGLHYLHTLIFTLFLLIILPGCSPKIVERIVYQRDTTVVHHRDSIIRRDSIYVKEWMKGDTVYIDRFRDRYIYKDRWRDSIRVVRDSVSVEHIKEVKVEKPLSWWQKARIGAFWWLIGAVIALLAWVFRKPLMKCLGLR